jgi:GMP synthase (glutamine-hydrolysing)
VRPLLIVKTGAAPPEIVAERGDFEDWISRRLDAPSLPIEVLDVEHGAALPATGSIAAVVVTGSSAMVSERAPWSEAAAAWLADVARAGTPVLGICYGHQLLAHGLGGEVGRNPNGREIGTVTVDVEVPDDALLGQLPSRLTVQETHRESVLRLPPGARRLAGNRADPHQAFRFGDRAWGVQFHPEFDAAVSRGYLTRRRAELLAEGLDPDALLAGCRDAPDGARLLARFAALVRDHEDRRA